MGKFYLDNKHKWFLHQAERSHEKRMRDGVCLAAAAEVVDEIRFYLRDEDGKAPSHVRISDHGLPQLAVLSANAFVGLLDAASSQVMRAFLAKNDCFKGACPAVVVRQDPISGAYVLKLGYK